MRLILLLDRVSATELTLQCRDAVVCSRPPQLPLLESLVLKGEPARHARGTDARSPARDCTSVVNRRGRLFKIARERAD